MADESGDETETGEWDFYYCRVDDAPASIFLNFAYQQERPALDTLYYAGLQMLDPAEHGMGGPKDAEALWALEDEITAGAAAAGFTYVGRLRNQGDWQLTFYAAAGKEAALEEIVVVALADADRGYRIGSQEDAEWGYYDEFLMPNAERFQWIMNRRVVQQLEGSGDQVETPREVDHFIHFADADARDAFARAAEALGFRAEPQDPDQTNNLPFGISLHRDDAVTLNHIHEVVMTLSDLADENGGDYDGWGAPVVPDPKTQN
jgi:regulator of RNase E activity RraB